jgi:hypothetical protein
MNQILRGQAKGKKCRNGCGFVSHAHNIRTRASVERRHALNDCPLKNMEN